MEYFISIMSNQFVAYIVYFVAIYSPVLNNAALWQQKEWRIDRLTIHFQEVGFIWQLWSKSRVLFLGVSYIVVLVAYITNSFMDAAVYLQLIGLLTLTIFQVVTHKQRSPQWTQKAIMMVLLSIVLSCILFYVPMILWPLGVVATPLFVYAAWTILYPIDYVLKQRILQAATVLRKKLTHCTVIAITGSVGKTTTKDVLAHILDSKNAWVTPKHINTELGLAQWFISKMHTATRLPDILVLEMGAYRIGEIALMCRVFQPTIGIITYIGTQHIALFGSQENIWLGKSEIIHNLLSSEFAILHGDHEYTASAQKRTRAHVITVGTKNHNTHKISQIVENTTGISFVLQDKAYHTKIDGIHNVYNIAFAIIAAELTGMNREEIAERIPDITLQKGTFTVEKSDQYRIVNDTYNSSPESIIAAIQWAKTQPEASKVLVIAGLLEQGNLRATVHATIAKEAQGIFTQILCFDSITQQELQSGSMFPIDLYSSKVQIVKNSLIVCSGRIPPLFLQNVKKIHS